MSKLEEPYWEMYQEWKRSPNHLHRSYVGPANQQTKKIMRRKHLWQVSFYTPDFLTLSDHYFPSREKAARFWVLSR